mgnify:CR=1 FL=1
MINKIKTTNIILGVIVFAAICGIGYYFWNKKRVEAEDADLINGPAEKPGEEA